MKVATDELKKRLPKHSLIFLKISNHSQASWSTWACKTNLTFQESISNQFLKAFLKPNNQGPSFHHWVLKQKFLDPIPFKRTELEVRFCSNFRFSLAGVFAHCDSWDDGQLGKKDHLSIGCSGHQSSLISKQVDGGNAVGRRPRAPHHHRDHERASRRHAARVVLLRLRRNEKLQEREKRPPWAFLVQVRWHQSHHQHQPVFRPKTCFNSFQRTRSKSYRSHKLAARTSIQRTALLWKAQCRTARLKIPNRQ